MLQEITATQLKSWLEEKKDFQLVDVRESWERDAVAIPGSRHIPLKTLPERRGDLDPQKTTVLYCHHGMRSFNAGMFLTQEGFEDVYNLVGGIDAYALEADPSLARY